MDLKPSWWRAPALAAFLLLSTFAVTAPAGAQAPPNLPPPGAYQPIPNFVGVGAGAQFRKAINDRFSGVQPIAPEVITISFANLPTEQNGMLLFCSDCKLASPCAGNGAGAWALGARGQWTCSGTPLEATLNANGNKISNLATATAPGDAIPFGQSSGGDLSGTLPNPIVQTVLGGKIPIYSGQLGAQLNSLGGALLDGSDNLGPFNINGVLNVKDKGAKGDGLNDDTAAIQSTIYTACGATPPTQPANLTHGSIYFPSVNIPGATANSCYLHSQPIQLTCGKINLYGEGAMSALCQNYYGPAILSAAYGMDTLNYQAPLVTAGSYPIKSIRNDGCAGANCGLVYPTDFFTSSVRSAITTNFTVEAMFEPTGTCNGCILFERYPAHPATNNSASSAVYRYLYTTLSSSNNITGKLKVGGTLYTLTGSASIALNAVHHGAIELDNNGGNATIRLFFDGVQVATQVVGGSPTVTWDQFDTEMIPPEGPAAFPDGAPSLGAAPQLTGPYRYSNSARYNGSYTIPTADWVIDASTVLLLDFPVSSPDQFAIAQTRLNVTTAANVFLLIRGGNVSANQNSNVNLHDLELSPAVSGITGGAKASDGLAAKWTPASTFKRLSNTVPYKYGFNFSVHDSGSKYEDLVVAGTPDVGILHGINDSESMGINNVGAGIVPFLYADHAGGVEIHPRYLDNGSAYGWVFLSSGHYELDWPFEDMQSANTSRLGSVWVSGSYAPLKIVGAEFNTRNGAPYLVQSSGSPITCDDCLFGTSGEDQAAAQLIHFFSSPTSAVHLIDSPNLNALAISDSPKDVITETGNAKTFGPGGRGTIDNASINGAKNPLAYGVIAGVTTTGTGSITSGTATLTLGAAGDWTNGEGIAVPKAGGSSALSTPAQPTVAATCPSGACATGYTYQAVALDSLCGSTAAGTVSASVINNATLDRTHFNTVTVTPVAAVASYMLFRGTTPVGVVINSVGTAAAKQDFLDYGQSYTVTSPCLPTSPPGAATPDALYTTILSGGGTTTLTLAANAGSTVASQTGVTHDDAFAINAAIATFNSTSGGVIRMPSAQPFIISQPVLIGAAATLPSEPQILGDGSAPPHFQASAMMQGLPVIRITNGFKPRIANIVIAGAASAPPIAGIELRVNNPVGNPVGGSFVGEALIENVSMDTNSPTNCVAFTAAPTYDANNSEGTIRNLTCNASHAGIYIGMINALDEHIEAGYIIGTDAAIYLNGGSFDVTGSNLSTGAAGWIVDLESGSYQHDISLSNPHFVAGGGLIKAAAADTGQPMAIQITGADSDSGFSGNSDGNLVEMLGTNRFSLSFAASHIAHDGIPNTAWVVNSNGRNLMLVNSHLSMNSISGNDNVLAFSNHFASACPTSTLSGIWSGADNVGDNGALCTGFANNLTVNNLTAVNGLGIGADNTVATMPRMPLTFPMTATAGTTTILYGGQKTVKAITVENGEFATTGFTCSVSPAFSIFDCGTTVNSCASPTATVATSGTIAAAGEVDMSLNTTAVAAGHYLALMFTAGTCTALNATATLMARPQ